MLRMNAGTRCWLKKEGVGLEKVGKPGGKVAEWTGGRVWVARNRRGGMELVALEEAGL